MSSTWTRQHVYLQILSRYKLRTCLTNAPLLVRAEKFRNGFAANGDIEWPYVELLILVTCRIARVAIVSRFRFAAGCDFVLYATIVMTQTTDDNAQVVGNVRLWLSLLLLVQGVLLQKTILRSGARATNVWSCLILIFRQQHDKALFVHNGNRDHVLRVDYIVQRRFNINSHYYFVMLAVKVYSCEVHLSLLIFQARDEECRRLVISHRWIQPSEWFVVHETIIR